MFFDRLKQIIVVTIHPELLKINVGDAVLCEIRVIKLCILKVLERKFYRWLTFIIIHSIAMNLIYQTKR